MEIPFRARFTFWVRVSTGFKLTDGIPTLLQEDPLETLGNLYLMVFMFFLTISHGKWVWEMGFFFGKDKWCGNQSFESSFPRFSLFLPFLMLSFQIFFCGMVIMT